MPVARGAALRCRLEGTCLERWARLDEQLAACYRGIALAPTLAELRRLFQQAKQQAGQQA